MSPADAYAAAKIDAAAAHESGVPVPKPDKPNNTGFQDYVRQEQAIMDKLAAQQATANNAANNYNHRGGITPAERAAAKGFIGVGTTANGGATFAGTSYMIPVGEGQSNIVTIVATGNREKDFGAANAAANLSSTPTGAVWHHVDNYDVVSDTITLELVQTPAHRASTPHSGGCAQYDSIHGPTYNR